MTFYMIFAFLLGDIRSVKHKLTLCQHPNPIMYQSIAMVAQADATRCCIIVILLVYFSLGEGGVIKANIRAKCYHQSFLVDDCTTNKI